MAGGTPKDPVAFWREMFVQWEQGVNAMATQVMSTGEFSREMNRMMGVSVRMQKAMQKMLARHFDALNLTTKDDFKGLGERLLSMEEQMIRMTAALERLAASDDSMSLHVPHRVARTKGFRGTEAAKS